MGLCSQELILDLSGRGNRFKLGNKNTNVHFIEIVVQYRRAMDIIKINPINIVENSYLSDDPIEGLLGQTELVSYP